MNDEKWSSNLLSLYLPNCLLFRSLHSLFHLVSIHFHFGTPPPAKKNNFWCSHQMSHYLRWVILLRIFYLNMSGWSSSFSFPFIWSSWTWVWCCYWNWGFGNSFLGFTHFFTDIFGCWSFCLNISFLFWEKRNIFKNGSGPKWTVQHDRPNWSPSLTVQTWTTNLAEPIWTATLTVQFDRPVWPPI